MGLLDRWSKKKTVEKLNDLKEKESAKVTVKPAVKAGKKPAKKVFEEEEKTAVKTTKSSGVIVKPRVTEKNARFESIGKYCFMVARDASKPAIKRAIFVEYGVMPVAVNVINTDGKRVRFGRSMGRRSDYRKAIITLPKGKTISIHQGV